MTDGKIIEENNTDPVFEKFNESLDIEIDVSKQRSYELGIDITSGFLKDHIAGEYIYTFRIEDTLSLKEDTPVELVIGEHIYNGSIVSLVEKEIRISINDNIGDKINNALIKTDNSFLLKRLKERLLETSDIKDTDIFNITLAKKTLGLEKSETKIDNSLKEKPPSLNDNQFNALKVISGSEILYLWGPPGTGKTFTLAEVIYQFYKSDKKILLVSNTNMAVDILLKSLCDQLVRIKDEEFNNGSVLRIGKIINEEVEKKYKDYVDINEVVKRHTKPLQIKISDLNKMQDELHFKKEPLDKNIESYNKFIKIKEDLKQHKSQLKSLEISFTETVSKLKTNELELDRLQKDLPDAKPEGNVLNTVADWMQGKKSKEAIERHISSIMMDQNNLKPLLKKIPKDIESINKKYDLLIKDKASLEPVVHHLNISTIKSDREKLCKELSQISDQVKKIQKEIEEKQNELLEKSRITATTATRTFLNPKSFKTYDLVVIDEASMLPLPLVFYVSGLSIGKVVVTGDFKQLPPIVQSANSKKINDKQKELINNWMNLDVFEKSGIAASVENNKAPPNLVQLKLQYRMDSKICDLINNRFYYGSLSTHESAGKAKDSYPEFFSNPLILVDTQEFQPYCSVKPRNNSKYNLLHAIAIRNFIKSLVKLKFITTPRDVGVITPYATQSKIINKILDEGDLENVECGTVHRFQGNEKDIIIFDTVETNGLPYIGQMWNDVKTMNVALSRARGFLIVLANMQYLEEKLDTTSLMKDILVDIEEKGKLVKLSELVEASPETLSSDIVDYKSSSIEKYNIQEHTFLKEDEFFKKLNSDLSSASKWIIIYSAFITENRISWWADIIRHKINEGVIVKCVIRPPSIKNYAQSYNAYKTLIELGAVVDLVAEIHQKYIWIDDEIFYIGSLNALSSNGAQETMLRHVDKKTAIAAAEHEIHRKGKTTGLDAIKFLTNKENPICPKCGSPDVSFHSRTRKRVTWGYGAYYRCQNPSCDWIQNYDKYHSEKNKNADGISHNSNTKMKRAISSDDNKNILKKIEEARKSDKLNDKEKNDFLKPGGNVDKRLKNNQALSAGQQKWLNDILSRFD